MARPPEAGKPSGVVRSVATRMGGNAGRSKGWGVVHRERDQAAKQ